MSRDKNKLSPREVSELLQNFYHPEEAGIKDFDEFYSELNKKIDDNSRASESASVRLDIEQDYQHREEQLKKMLNDMDIKSANKTHKVPAAKTSSKGMWITLIALLLVSLAAYAGYRYVSNYNYISLDDEFINWSALGLTNEQKSKLAEVDSQWEKLQAQQEAEIEFAKNKLSNELAKPKPNIALVDKYQREILDREIMLKREEANLFLEKRFILTEEQTQAALKQVRESK